ncbi:hypothetical protein [Glycocaulis sp.]
MLTQIIAAGLITTSMLTGSDRVPDSAPADVEAMRASAIQNFLTLNARQREEGERFEDDERWLEDNYEFNYTIKRSIRLYARCNRYSLHDIIVVADIEPDTTDGAKILFAAAYTQYQLELETTLSAALAARNYSQREIDLFLTVLRGHYARDWDFSRATSQPDEDRCVRAEQAVRDFVMAGQ